MLNIRLRLTGFINTREAVLAISQLNAHHEYSPSQECCIIIECHGVTGFSPGALNYLSRVQRTEFPNQHLFLVNKDMSGSVKLNKGSMQLV